MKMALLAVVIAELIADRRQAAMLAQQVELAARLVLLIAVRMDLPRGLLALARQAAVVEKVTRHLGAQECAVQAAESTAVVELALLEAAE